MSRQDGENKARRVLDLARFRKDKESGQAEQVLQAEFTRGELLTLAVALDELPESFGPVEELARKIDRMLYE